MNADDFAFRNMIRNGQATADQVRIARAIRDVVSPRPVYSHAVRAAEILEAQELAGYQIRALYGQGRAVYNMVTEALAETS